MIFLLGFWVGFLCLLFWRNVCVHRYQMRICRQVSDRAKEDIYAGRPWEWRYRMLNAVKYETMLLQFWRPLDSFYDLEVLLGEQEVGK